MQGRQSIHRFEFEDKLPINDQVYAAFADDFSIVCHRNLDLSGEGDAVFFQFDTHRFFVNLFGKARPEFAVYILSKCL